jgi:hypothetical protein
METTTTIRLVAGVLAVIIIAIIAYRRSKTEV